MMGAQDLKCPECSFKNASRITSTFFYRASLIDRVRLPNPKRKENEIERILALNPFKYSPWLSNSRLKVKPVFWCGLLRGLVCLLSTLSCALVEFPFQPSICLEMKIRHSSFSDGCKSHRAKQWAVFYTIQNRSISFLFYLILPLMSKSKVFYRHK